MINKRKILLSFLVLFSVLAAFVAFISTFDQIYRPHPIETEVEPMTGVEPHPIETEVEGRLEERRQAEEERRWAEAEWLRAEAEARRQDEKGVYRKGVMEEQRRAEAEARRPAEEEARRQVMLRHEVDTILEEMEIGAIAFNVPTRINIDDFSQIQLILSLAETEKQLKSFLVEEGEKVGASISVSDRMQARLTGYMFQITAITPEIQAVSESQRTEWKWEIHPKEEGKHKLHLTLTAFLEIDGHSTPRSIRSFDRFIEVYVTPPQKLKAFFKTNWQWLWAAILVPVIGWLWSRKKQLTKDSS